MSMIMTDTTHATDDGKGTPTRLGRTSPIFDGSEPRERAHRRHRRRYHIQLARHAILARLIKIVETWAPDFDHLLVALSGSRTYIGSAFNDPSRCRIIRTVGPPITTMEGGIHAHYLHRWAPASTASDALAWMRDNPIPDPVEDGDDSTDGDPVNKDARSGLPSGRASGCDANTSTNTNDEGNDR